MKQWAWAAMIAGTVSFAAPVRAAPPGPSASGAAPASAEADPAMSPAELDRMLQQTYEGDFDARRAAAKAASELGVDATLAITKKLAEMRREKNIPIGAMIKLAHDNTKTSGDQFDMVDGLLRGGKPELPGYKTAMVYACLMKSLAHIGTTAAAKQIILLAGDHNGQLRNEVSRTLRNMGDKAVPALIETRKDAPEIRHWAYQQLELMNKRLPGEAVQTKSNQVLADVLRAYAYVKEPDAISVVLSFVNSDRVQVRAAARDALLAYGQDAIWKLREAYVNLTGKSAPEGASAEQVARDLFAAYDRSRLQEVYALLEDGLKLQKEGKLAEAIANFDRVLARQPMLDRRGEMVFGYVTYAESIEDKDPAAALALLRKAARLDPDGPRAPQIQSEISYLEGKDLLAHGIADTESFRRALALDPGNARARAELDRLETDAEERQNRLRRWAAGGAVMAAAVAFVILFGGKKKKDETRSNKSGGPGMKRARAA
jgi:tetratricopeptide (TPR) repeat protein